MRYPITGYKLPPQSVSFVMDDAQIRERQKTSVGAQYPISSHAAGLPASGAKEKTMMKDVVCGMDVSENRDSVPLKHGGQEYAFCSPACRDKFQKNPQAYVQQTRQPESFKAP